ncbi:MAG TPA: hypothetical protein VF958_02415 [Thermoanaerobaculia bacterium]
MNRFPVMKVVLCALGGVLASGLVLAQVEPPLLPNGSGVPNWTVPTYHPSSAEGGLRTMADISPGVGFVAMQPCRVFDTRNANGPYGGPRLLANTTRNFDIDSGPCTGIPAGVEAYSMNFGAILPDGANSFITIWPAGTTQPGVSSINPVQGFVVANAAIVPAGTGGAISVFPNTGVHLYGDINGYFTADYANNNYFQVHVNSTGYAIDASNSSTSCSGTCGMRMSVDSGNGIEGQTHATSGATYGVFGNLFNATNGAAGIYGEGATGSCGTPSFSAGVLGRAGAAASGEIPIIGMGDYEGVRGINTSGCTNTVATYGSLGYTDATAVYGSGNLVITGTKSFADPHPTDPSKMIAYVSLEGPESGTYFRGKARFQNGVAVIEVPEHFRMVTDPEGLSIQVTPIGQMATVAVESIGLDRIVVRGSRNVEFFYTVNGVRTTFKDFQPIQDNIAFVGTAEDAGMPGAWSPEQKRRLVASGAFNPDGTVNRETAHRLGWDSFWESRRPQRESKPSTASPSKAPVSSNQ